MKAIIRLCNSILIQKRERKQPVLPLKKVVVVSNTGLGDAILSTPAIRTLRLNFPDIYIEWLVNRKIYSLFKDCELVDNVKIYNKGLYWLLCYSRYLRKNNFDTIFFLHSNGPQDLFLALKSRVNNILKAMSYPNKVSSEFNKIILNSANNNKNQHMIEYRLDLIRIFQPKTIITTLYLPKTILSNLPRKNKEFTLGIQVGAQDRYKMWRVEHYVNLLNRLYEYKSDITFVFFGIATEYEIINSVITNLESKNIVNLCDKTTISTLPNQLKPMHLLLTPDTGTMHLAIALQVPTISLFSPTESHVFGAYEDKNIHYIIQKDGEYINSKPKKMRTQDAMDLISVDEVLEQIKKCVE